MAVAQPRDDAVPVGQVWRVGNSEKVPDGWVGLVGLWLKKGVEKDERASATLVLRWSRHDEENELENSFYSGG